MKAKRKRRKVKKSKSVLNRIISCFLIFFVVVVCVSLYSQAKTLYRLKNEESMITSQLESEKKRNLEITSSAEYYKSDAYIESVAREKLGLVMPGEIVFINKAE